MTKWLKCIAVLEMIGGAVGILYCPYMLIMSGLRLDALIIISLFLLIYILSLTAGIYLWKGTRFGRIASIVVQFLQLPKIISPIASITFSFGFDLYPHLTIIDGFSAVGFQFRFLADGQLFFNSGGAPLLLGFSIPAAVALVKLRNFDPDGIEVAGIFEQLPPSPDEYDDLKFN